MVAVPDPHPSLDTVRQPGLTEFKAPLDYKTRVKASYDAYADRDNGGTPARNPAHRTEMVKKVFELLLQGAREDDRNKAWMAAMRSGNRAVTRPFVRTPRGAVVPTLWGMHALEAGCGGGAPVIEMLLAEEIDTVAVDISRRQVDAAKGRFPEATRTLRAVWAEQDMMDMRFPPAEFNMVVALYSLMHLEQAEQTVFLHRAHRWLKPGGMLLINFPRDEVQGQVIDRWQGMENGLMFKSSWGEVKTLHIIRELGFQIMVQRVTGDDSVCEPSFMWVIAKKPKPLAPPKKEEWVRRSRAHTDAEPLAEDPMTVQGLKDGGVV
ncbi:S-adenosyl-L-methionine-dependent methyltransferase [Staphylotrichum tortipilum]|uniref:S-adenosyl-L-methionine-dependent methyltransferase n=1 Tax=Staphylotrichum tortipilum TaxID=2831512 RepID=A0AAN6ME98_9PEZI|nr:S-adenosyl-L-methionine-dependent methyltransferase [Staphylotrichum longicolle]